LDRSIASVSFEDRGYQFSDGVYEVFALHNGNLIDEPAHFERLFKSLRELSIEVPWSPSVIKVIIAEVLRRNRIQYGNVYLQITRGNAKRMHEFPRILPKPSLVVVANRISYPIEKSIKGVSVRTLPDIRWRRADIKTISLLPNVLAKQKAVMDEFNEAWFVDTEGKVTEGASTNAWIVDYKGRLITRGLGKDILAGVTRNRVMKLAQRDGFNILERGFTVEEAYSAAEAFMTSTTAGVKPVIKIDDREIADSSPGKVTLRLLALYSEFLAIA